MAREVAAGVAATDPRPGARQCFRQHNDQVAGTSFFGSQLIMERNSLPTCSI